MGVNDDQLEIPAPAVELAAFDIYYKQTAPGKRRKIHKPRPYTRFLHLKLIAKLRQGLPRLTWSTAGRPGNSILKHFELHSYNRYWYTLDLEAAYDQVDRMKLSQLVYPLMPYEERNPVDKFRLEMELGYFFMQEGGKGLATGANASPELFNIYCHYVIDRQIAEICVPRQLSFSRYMDDIIISGQRPITRTERRLIREAILRGGLNISPKQSKTGLYDMARDPVVLSGVELFWRSADKRVQFHVPQEELERLHKLLDEAIAHPSRYNQSQVAGQMAQAIGIMRRRHRFPPRHHRLSHRPKPQTEGQLRLIRKWQRYQKLMAKRRAAAKAVATP